MLVLQLAPATGQAKENIAHDEPKVPGIVVNHVPASTGIYIGSPSLAIHSDGRYVATHDEFGPRSTEHTSAVTRVYRSSDRGTTWEPIAKIQGQFWSTLFSHQGSLYLIGTDKHHGNLIIRRSDDAGETWTEPQDAKSGLLKKGEFHCAPQPVVIHDGRIWRAMEDASGGVKWGERYMPFVMSAPSHSDLLNRDSWAFTNRVSSNKKWLGGDFGGVLEGNAVVDPKGHVVNILRAACRPSLVGKAALMHVSDNANKLTFDPRSDFVDLPGGSKKFTIRQDPVTGHYWSLVNWVKPDFIGKYKPSGIRNTLALVSSPDLINWRIERQVLHKPDLKYGYQYADWQFDGDDLIAVVRTAEDDQEGGAHSFHDANYITFHRIVDFRKSQEQLGGQSNDAAHSHVTQPFNVLFIAVDDMRTDLGCFGSTVVKSPYIDELADRGLLFQRAYCQQSLCNPSRASLMTGLRIDTLGISDLFTHFREVRPDIVTLPQLFKENGYQAVGIGKLFHNFHPNAFKGDAKSWTRKQFYHYGNHNRDEAKVSGERPRDQYSMARVEKREVADEAYRDGRIAAKAVEVLREIKNDPFFLGVGFWKPHLPFNAPAKYWNLYDPNTIALPLNPHPPEGVPSIALHSSRELLRDFPDGLSDEQVLILRHGYLAAISYVDAQIGKILNELDRLELRDKTIIVFWSDHGFHLGEHALWCKNSNFELDARVPLIISVPGQATKGKQTNALVELLDLYPTLADLCKLSPPKDLEGKSLLPLLENEHATVKQYALTQNPRPDYQPKGTDPEIMGYSVRTDNYRYTEWRQLKTQKVIATELYNHLIDPMELRNCVTLPKYQAQRSELSAILSSLLKEGQ